MNFWLCFVPLFVSVDAIGLLPTFMGLTGGLEKKLIHKIIIQSIITAMIVALTFLAVGSVILQYIGITVDDFLIAGGALLFVISLNDILSVDARETTLDSESFGSVPLGVPLMVGPAVLAAEILLSGQYGWISTAVATIINILFAGVVFFLSVPIYKFLGKPGAKTFSKIANLLLAAIAVMMIRKGIVGIISGLK